MFGLFSKKPSVADSINSCASLVRSAKITVVLEKGKYTGFLVALTADTATITSHIKVPEAMSALIEGIEDRITNRQFEDPSGGIGMLQEMREVSGGKANTNVARVLLGREGKPILNWNPATQ